MSTATAPTCLAEARAAVEPYLASALHGLSPHSRLVCGYHLGWNDPSGRPLESNGGKPTGNDLRQRKKTLPVTFGLTEEGECGRELRRILGWETIGDKEVDRARVLLEQSGAGRWIREFVATQAELSVQALQVVEVPAEVRAGLQNVIRFVADRSF